VGHGLHSTLHGFRSGHVPPQLEVRIGIKIGQGESGQFICYKTGQIYLLTTEIQRQAIGGVALKNSLKLFTKDQHFENIPGLLLVA